VKTVLFRFAREHLPSYLASHSQDAEVREALAETRRLAGDGSLDAQGVLRALLGWIDEDRKAPPLKTLQGLIWEDGYANGALCSQVYPDAASTLRRWREEGLRLAVYSSGSVLAQRLVFRHSDQGNLEGLFDGFFDTTVGPKQSPDSYRHIVQALDAQAEEILFLSDSSAELDAAADAGMATTQLVRPEDGTMPSDHHPPAATFDQIRWSDEEIRWPKK
jgi:enolase-phosphatase E1